MVNPILSNSNMGADISGKFVGLEQPQLESVARMFGALAEPTRLRILQALQAGELTVGQIVQQTGARQANISKQLGILHAAGVVSRQREGNIVRYFISEPIIFELCRLVCAKLRRDGEAQAKAFR
jgi:DNA-binding transcriptional ArsR family regulator